MEEVGSPSPPQVAPRPEAVHNMLKIGFGIFQKKFHKTYTIAAASEIEIKDLVFSSEPSA